MLMLTRVFVWPLALPIILATNLQSNVFLIVQYHFMEILSLQSVLLSVQMDILEIVNNKNV